MYMTKLIPLTRNKFAIVDDDDYEYLSQQKWTYHHEGYAYRQEPIEDKYATVLMHRRIMKTPKGLDVDHINRNGLDNRKSNLRNVTHSQNLHNRPKQKNSHNKYKGIYLDKRVNRWFARIKVDGKSISLRSYKTQEEAGEAYRLASDQYVWSKVGK